MHVFAWLHSRRLGQDGVAPLPRCPIFDGPKWEGHHTSTFRARSRALHLPDDTPAPHATHETPSSPAKYLLVSKCINLATSDPAH